MSKKTAPTKLSKTVQRLDNQRLKPLIQLKILRKVARWGGFEPPTP